MAISKWKKTIGTVLQRVCKYEILNYNEDILIPFGSESMAPSPSKERNSVYDIRRLVYTTWQRNRIENSELNEIDGISSPKRAFHRLCSSNRVPLLLPFQNSLVFLSPNPITLLKQATDAIASHTLASCFQLLVLPPAKNGLSFFFAALTISFFSPTCRKNSCPPYCFRIFRMHN